jgi:lipopolysaccharide export system permease protein
LKKLDLFLIKTYIGPFVLTFFITLFVLEMQFLWNYLEDMVGKGLEVYVLVELFLFASASLVSMALPLAILLSSIMTMGSLGENYELVALKSSGISVNRIMRPLFVLVLFLSGLAFYHSNYLLPVSNLKFKSLLYDIRHQRPALEFKPGVFYDGIDGYVIRIRDKDKETGELFGVQIFDHSSGEGNRRVTLADKGKMYMSGDGGALIFELNKVKSYDEIKGQSYPLAIMTMDKHTVRFDLSSFQFSRTDEDLFKDHYQMLNLSQLQTSIDSLDSKKETRLDSYSEAMKKRHLFYSDTNYTMDSLLDADTLTLLSDLSYRNKLDIYNSAINSVRSAKTYSMTIAEEMRVRQERINRHVIEWHRKFTLSVACIVLFFVGAPLGAIIRRGGLGMPVVISILIFIIYHIISMSGEKLVRQGELPGFIGMWISTLVLIPVGAFLTYKSTTDSVLLDATFYNKLVEQLARVFSPIIKLIKLLFKKKNANIADLS